MTHLLSTQRIIRISLAGSLALGLATLAGCGIGTSPSSTSTVIPSFTGKAMGGQAPIVGATVKIYATTSSGYGIGSPLKEADQQGTSAGQDTDAGGNFTFSGTYTCPANQFAYIVSSGGNTGANAVNPNSVLVAALGRCEDLYQNTAGGAYDGPLIYVNELTTVAAAYALGNFTSMTGTGATVLVGIGAPATNNAPQSLGVSTGCVANGTTCSTTVAAGLAHAFLNATNLVNPFANTFLTGANAHLPGDSAAIVPQELIDSLGNILVSCVNSTGDTGSTSACDQLFVATTVGGTAPTNTFSAMINLAANPTLNGTPATVATLFTLATPQTSVYSPALGTSAGLNDFSIGITYPVGLGASTVAAPLSTCTSSTTSPCQGLVFPTSGALDINDVYYVANSNGASGTTPVNLFAFSSNGRLLSNTTNGTAVHAYGLSVDAIGNGYFANGSTSATNALGVFTTGGGLLSPYTIKAAGGIKVYVTATDRLNNVWAFGSAGSGPSLVMSPSGGATFTAQGTFSEGTPTSNGPGIAIDSNQNIWVTSGLSSTPTVAVLPNNGTVSAPTYTATQITGTTTGAIPSGIAFVPGTGGLPSAYTAFYQPGTTGIQPFTPTYSGAQLTALGENVIASPATITGTEFSAEGDGTGHVWLADTNSHSVVQFTPNLTPANDTAYQYKPCLGGSTTCASVFATGKPFTVSIDSTGSIWVTNEAVGALVQIIGAAAPTWPLRSLGLTGTP